MLTGVLVERTVQLPSHLGSSFPAVGTDHQTVVPGLNENGCHKPISGSDLLETGLTQQNLITQQVFFGGEPDMS